MPDLERVEVTAVDLVVRVRDQSGESPEALESGDLLVAEDGIDQTVLGIERLSSDSRDSSVTGPGWFSVVYFDVALSERKALEAAAASLAEQAGNLTRLGPVEVVVAQESTVVVQPATRDEAALRAALRRIAREVRGQSQVAAVRRRFLQALSDDADALSEITPRGGGGAGPAGRPGSVEGLERRRASARLDDSGRQMQIRSAVRRERAVVEARRDLLTDHLARYRRRSRQTLILVSDGYDADPKSFYLAGASERLQSRLSAELAAFDSSAAMAAAARLLAGSNWTVLGLALGGRRGGMTAPASERGAVIRQDAGSGQTAGSRSAARFLLTSPLEPLERFARDSGGEVLTSERDLAMALSDLESSFRLTYQVPRPPDGKIHAIEVRAVAPGLVVRAPRWVGSQTPEEVAAHRARQIAAGLELGDLALEAMVLFDGSKDGETGATVAARLRLDPLDAVRAQLSQAALRVTTVFYFADRPPFVHHAVVQDQDLSTGAHWGHSARVTLPADTRAVVVIVEELATGSWGGSSAPRVRPRAARP